MSFHHLFQLVALKRQPVAFIEFEELPKGFQCFSIYRNFYASTNYRIPRFLMFFELVFGVSSKPLMLEFELRKFFRMC